MSLSAFFQAVLINEGTPILMAPLTTDHTPSEFRIISATTASVYNSTTGLGNGQWRFESNAAYEGNSAMYSLAQGDGYTFRFAGTSFILRGAKLTNGADIRVIVDDIEFSGSCYSPFVTKDIYFQLPSPLAFGVHTVKVISTSIDNSKVIILDTVVLS